jgi:hypothetical protein
MYEGLCREGVFQIEHRTSEFKSTADMDVNEYIVDILPYDKRVI